AELCNRLSATSAPGDIPAGPYSDRYTHDEHGNMTRMPHLPAMSWDVSDRLQSTTRQIINAGTPETTYYAYSSAGQRTRKVTERQASQGQNPAVKSERLYLGAIELYREYAPDGAVTLERETLHVFDGRERTLLVETRTAGQDPAPARMAR